MVNQLIIKIILIIDCKSVISIIPRHSYHIVFCGNVDGSVFDKLIWHTIGP